VRCLLYFGETFGYECVYLLDFFCHKVPHACWFRTIAVNDSLLQFLLQELCKIVCNELLVVMVDKSLGSDICNRQYRFQIKVKNEAES